MNYEKSTKIIFICFIFIILLNGYNSYKNLENKLLECDEIYTKILYDEEETSNFKLIKCKDNEHVIDIFDLRINGE